MTITCDVLVVGGGPAGCSAARAASKNGVKTILIEEDKEIGKPVQCAEGIGKYLIPFLPFKVPSNQFIWEIKGMNFWAKDILIQRNGGIWAGYTINRTRWDQWLANQAKKQGTNIKTNTKLIDLKYDNNLIIKKAIVKSNNKKIEIYPKIVIAADGIQSTTVKLLKLRQNEEQFIGEVKSYELDNVELKYPQHDQLFLGDFAPNAYAYIFPISNKRANIGIGNLNNKKNNIELLYRKFTEIPIVKEQIKNAKEITEKSGCAPVKYSPDEWIFGNTLLTGDSANQNFKPFIEGNLPAIICGDIAGKISAESINDIENLKKYKLNVNKKLRLMFNSSNEITDMLLEIKNLKNKDLLNLILFSNIFSLRNIKNIMKSNEKEILEKILNWKKSKLKRFKTILIEDFYLIYLSTMRQLRRL